MTVEAGNASPEGHRRHTGTRSSCTCTTPIGDAVRSALTSMGHVLIDQPPIVFGGAQAIVRLARGYAAGSDPRKDGMAVGY